MKKLFASLAVSLALISAPAIAETTLRLSSWAGPNHPINSQVLSQWAEDVNQATDGRVSIDILYDIAPPPAQMETVADNIADIGWIFHGFAPGRFVLTKVAEFPLENEFTAEQISVAYWRTHKEYFEGANEHRGLKVLGLGVHGPGQLMTTDLVTSFDDIQRSKIRVGGGVITDVAEKLGVNRVAMPTPEVYQAISQGVVNGTFLAVETLRSMNLADVSPYVYYMPGGMYGGTFSIFINSDVWANLSKEDRIAIESVSYENLSQLFGQVMHNADTVGLEYGAENGVTVTRASKDDIDKVYKISNELKQSWVEEVSKKYSIDGQAALDFFNKQLNSL